MIDALLEHSRIETQGNPFEPVDLATVLEAGGAQFPQAQQKDERRYQF